MRRAAPGLGFRKGLGLAEGVIAAGSGITTLLSAHAFINVRLLRRSAVNPAGVEDRVSVCIPARDEEKNIVDCLTSVLASASLADYEVLVVDDGSTDATAEVVERIAASDARVRLIRAVGEPPPGWLGKPHATEQLRLAATGQILVFVDADVRLQPAAIVSAVAVMREHDFAMVCPYPRQLAMSVGERVVQPLLQWLWITFLPLRLAERLRPATMVAANGQFMVVDAKGLASIGGFGAVKGEVLDDVALGRAFKRAGCRVALMDGTDLAECRMYDNWRSLVVGYSKSLWSASGTPIGAVAFSSILALSYIAPPLAAVLGLATRRHRLGLLGLFGYLAGVAGRLVSARATGARRNDALLHPVSIGALIGLLWRSWRGKRGGTLSWKGRNLGGNAGNDKHIDTQADARDDAESIVAGN